MYIYIYKAVGESRGETQGREEALGRSTEAEGEIVVGREAGGGRESRGEEGGRARKALVHPPPHSCPRLPIYPHMPAYTCI